MAQLRKAVTQAEGNIKRLKQQVDTVKATESVQKAQTVSYTHLGKAGAASIPAFSTASGNLTGCAVPSTTMGVARLRRHSRAARTPMAVCGSSSSPHSLSLIHI